MFERMGGAPDQLAGANDGAGICKGAIVLADVGTVRSELRGEGRMVVEIEGNTGIAADRNENLPDAANGGEILFFVTKVSHFMRNEPSPAGIPKNQRSHGSGRIDQSALHRSHRHQTAFEATPSHGSGALRCLEELFDRGKQVLEDVSPGLQIHPGYWSRRIILQRIEWATSLGPLVPPQ
jgi:hypothetical protein